MDSWLNDEALRIFSAACLAIVSMLSMVVGVGLGTYMRPSHRLIANIMAFGTGALIQALAIQLALYGASHLIEKEQYSGWLAWLIVSGGFIFGGLGYYLGNKALEKRGAAIRHPALAKFYLLNKKRQESKGLLEKLSNVALLRSLPPEEIQAILDFVTPMDFTPGEVVFNLGDAADGLYLISEGQVDIIQPGDIEDHVIASLSPGDSFGEMALLSGEPRYASARCVTAAKLLKINKEHFEALITVSPNLKRAVEKLSSQRILSNVQEIGSQVDKIHWQNVALSNIQRLTYAEESAALQTQAKTGSPLALFIGAMMDTIPESIVIGAGFLSFATYDFTFLAAVFLSNLPEAMASSSAMIQAGFSKIRIYSLWGALILSGTIAAVLGNAFLLDAPPALITFVEAVAGGGILAMVASVMMPEAYEDGGPEVGLLTIAGFLAAFFFTLV